MGYINTWQRCFSKNASESKSYKLCEDWLNKSLNQNATITKDVSQLYLNWFNEMLSTNKKLLLKRIFNFDIEAEKIEILNYKRNNDISLQWNADSTRYSVTKTYIKFPTQDSYTKEDILKMNAYICWNLLMYGIALSFVHPYSKRKKDWRTYIFTCFKNWIHVNLFSIIREIYSNEFFCIFR